MFCYQRSFGLPTETVTIEQFWALITAPETFNKVKAAREALARGDKKTYAQKKKSLPFVIFIATYDESEKEFENKDTGEKTKRVGRWRNQKYCRLNGLCVIDFDHIEGDPREVWEAAYANLSDEDKARILFVFVTPSGQGLKVVFMADPAVGNLIDNQITFSVKLGLNPDESCKDGSRGAFLTTIDDVIFIDKEKLVNYENEEFGKKYNEQYHLGNTQPTINSGKNTADSHRLASVQGAGEDQSAVSGGDGDDSRAAELLTYHGVAITEIIDKLLGGKVPEQGDRHEKMRNLAHLLRYVCDNSPKKLMAALKTQQWVLDLIAEGDPVEATVEGACKLKYGKEKPAELLKALGLGVEDKDDIYASLPLDQWADEIQELAEHYPCMKELFLNVHPHKLPAVLFSTAALFGTLMTRTWYHFWFDPELERRLNYCIFIIGDPGAGKNVIEKFYKKIGEPIIEADQVGLDALNRYKDEYTERSTSTKAQKGDPLKKPVVPIRVHPARTGVGEFIRHMRAAVVIIQGRPLNLHMFSFDAELDNVTKQNKGGDWKDREVMELKAFHNEEDGQMYGNKESFSGLFNIYWNFIYTGTPYALHRKVNQRNYGTGMSTRLAVIPLPDVGTAQRHQKVDPHANETIRTWAYRLDKVEGELPIEPLNDETYEWQAAKMEIADFNGDKAERSLVKRIPYYGIGVSLPFILMRHWDEWQEHRTLTMDDLDLRLCRLAMDIQYKCQHLFFGEMAYNYYANQNKEFVVRRRTTRYDECYSKLPDEFKTQQFMEVFGCGSSTAATSINRLKKDGVIENVKFGLYRKVLQELP